jgi:hypothetical protein
MGSSVEADGPSVVVVSVHAADRRRGAGGSAARATEHIPVAVPTTDLAVRWGAQARLNGAPWPVTPSATLAMADRPVLATAGATQ